MQQVTNTKHIQYIQLTEITEPSQTIEECVLFSEPVYDEDEYMLMKIAMAEAECQDTVGKALVIRVVLNRVEHKDFPDTIKDVIFQKNQFQPTRNGRYDRVEPNEDCKKALELVKSGWDGTQGALFFRTTVKESTWHSRNLEKLFEHGSMTYYKEKQ